MKWETTKPTIETPRHTLDYGPILLSIQPAKDRVGLWQHCMISFGEFAACDADGAMASWPAVAISRARIALYEFEKSLQEGNS